jgi:LPXTG-motif cell wall-anchored protein
MFRNALLTLVSVWCVCVQASAQNISAALKADSTEIQIGDHLHIELAVKFSGINNPVWPTITGTLGQMEIISTTPIDTEHTDKGDILKQGFVVSAYDSGEFIAGPVGILYSNNGSIDTFFSNDIVITVSTLAVDTARPFMPIKAPLKVAMTWKEYLPYILLGWLGLTIIGGILFLIFRKKKEKPQVGRERPKDPPHIWAKKELRKLEEEKLWQNDDVKGYYSRLTDILRLYIEYRYEMPALESTTDEIESEIDKYHVKRKAKEMLMEILRLSDLVKFAKMLPGPDRHINSLQQANSFIDLTAPKEEDQKPQEKK